MRETDIPDFVDAVIATGCEICAVGTLGYIFGDADLPGDQYELVRDEIARIDEVYGKRDHLKEHIIAYLWSIGRMVEIPTLQ
ncbi:hypothetical protein J5289_18485 [Rhizobium sp. B230/85]|uniref:hypothetical protein n=1 Tax=unclassified Rhizobium TaxID=2613769 RepID=UPI001ADD41F7|nr:MULTISPECIES: hypothetical protein [unclassified Rhizobium]MBO9136275.1 hypothetical protein [Rhizobium sp. B209b/85]QXZ98571.1 hypothetical protein J5289_18485 [Rhizobium sp. B230/85]